MGDTFGSFGIHFNHSFYVKKGIHWLNGGASRKKNRQVCSNNTLEKLGKTKFIALKLTFFKKQFKIGAKYLLISATPIAPPHHCNGTCIHIETLSVVERLSCHPRLAYHLHLITIFKWICSRLLIPI